jgi:phosphoribosylformylglycinamidine synthase
VERTSLPCTSALKAGQVLCVPMAHAEGNYTLDAAGLADLEARNGVAFRYCDARGNVGEDHTPNGAANAIAGITNLRGNVLGMMPHPERAVEAAQGGVEGLPIFQSLAAAFTRA